MYLDTSITRFPLGRNGREKYDVVYMGDVFTYSNRWSEKFKDKYVFLFSTIDSSFENNGKKTKYKDVRIDVIKDIEISYFNPCLQSTQAQYHIYKGGKLVINDYLEIIEDETESLKQWSAHLKEQVFFKDREPTFMKDIRVFLFSEKKYGNNSINFDNLPQVQVAPEIEAKIEYDLSKEKLEEHRDGYYYLQGLTRKLKDEHELQLFNKILDIAKEKEKISASKRDNAHAKYIQTLHSCGYHYKNE